MGKFDPSTFIRYQQEYGAGSGPYYGDAGHFDEYVANGDGSIDVAVPTCKVASCGTKFS